MVYCIFSEFVKGYVQDSHFLIFVILLIKLTYGSPLICDVVKYHFKTIITCHFVARTPALLFLTDIYIFDVLIVRKTELDSEHIPSILKSDARDDWLIMT